MLRHSLVLASVAFVALALPARSDSAVPGFTLAARANPVFGSTSCLLPGGDLVTFDGQHVERWTITGTHVATLATLPSSAWWSFVTPTPDGSTVYFGESSNQGIYRAATDGSGWAWMNTVTNAYAATVAATGDLYLTAQPYGSGLGTYVVRLDTAPPYSWTAIGNVSGASGPLAFDPAGNLYYATQDTVYPANPGSTDVLRWSAAQVAAGGFSELDATLFAADFDGGAALAFDAKGGDLLLAECNDGLFEYSVVRVSQDKAHSQVLASAGRWITSLTLLERGSPATLDAYQPSTGTNLVYATTDFWSVDDLVTLAPARPVLSASGAGTTGTGPVTLTLSGGVPNGTLFLFFCSLSDYSPTESVYNFGGFKLFTGLTLAKSRRVQFLLPTDANGNGALTIWNPGSLQGLYAFQALVGKPSGAFVGASTSALF
jgi:hypothetical protein